jgi:hypothetical protein
MKLHLALIFLFLPSLARAEPQASAPPVNPYRIYWAFPADDKTSVEVDDPDLSVSKWQTRWAFVHDMQTCDTKQSLKLRERRDKSVREVRIETLDGDGEPRSVTRCVMTLTQWKKRLGLELYERLEAELDAHESFVHPRQYPGMPGNPQRQILDDETKK